MPYNVFKKGKCSQCSAPARSAEITVTGNNRLHVRPAQAEAEKCSPASDTEAYVCTECGHIDFFAADLNVFKEPNR